MKLTYWILALVITLGVGHIAAQASTEADLEDAAALSSRDFVAQVICGKGKVAVWISDTQHDCLKERP